MATIHEVAALAGVSPATVSRVFNGVPVSPSYAERVRVAAAELRYTPNRAARTLRRRTSEVIALIIPDIENPFFTALARGVEDSAQTAGLSVVLCNTDERHDKETRYLQVALSEHMAGVVLAPATDHPDLAALVGRDIPVVAVDRSAHGFRLDTVLIDNRAVGRAATEKLYAEGHALVGCITGPATVETAQQRAAGWREVFDRFSPDADADDYLRHADYRVDGGHKAMRSLLAMPTPPGAVLVGNNLMGVGALQALDALRPADALQAPDALRPPDPAATVGVLVLGDLPFGMFPRAGTSVLPLPARDLGVTAANLLLQRIGGETAPARHVVLGTS